MFVKKNKTREELCIWNEFRPLEIKTSQNIRISGEKFENLAYAYKTSFLRKVTKLF